MHFLPSWPIIASSLLKNKSCWLFMILRVWHGGVVYGVYEFCSVTRHYSLLVWWPMYTERASPWLGSWVRCVNILLRQKNLNAWVNFNNLCCPLIRQNQKILGILSAMCQRMRKESWNIKPYWETKVKIILAILDHDRCNKEILKKANAFHANLWKTLHLRLVGKLKNLWENTCLPN